MIEEDKFKLTEEDIEIGMENFLTQLLIEAKSKRSDAKTLEDISSRHPKISYIVGQPGAGKTSIEKYIQGEYAKKDECTVEISADKVATYHKYYDELLKLLPNECYMHTRKFVTPACEVILKKVRDKSINIVRECALCKGEQDYRRIKDFKDSGYEVEINIIAVDKYESFLSCIERDVKLLELGYDPRPVTRKNHDNMYNAFFNELTELGKRGICDRVNVFTRGKDLNHPELVYTTGDDKYPNAQEAVVSERAKERKIIMQEPNKYLERISKAKQKIENMVQDEKMKEDYLERLNMLETEFLNELSFDRNQD